MFDYFQLDYVLWKATVTFFFHFQNTAFLSFAFCRVWLNLENG